MQKTLKVVAIAFAFVAAVSTANAAFDTNLTVGSTGSDVASLQTWLISKNFAIPAISSGVAQPGYFGSQTVAAVKAYQAANGIPSTGFFGPLTRAAVNKIGGAAPVAMGCPIGYTCTANPGTIPATTATPSTGALAGTDGSISDVNELSQYASEEVGDGQKDVKVMGFEVEASNDGDILLRSVKISFDPAGNSSADSDHLDDYITSVNVWMGDKKIGSADADDFTEDSSDVYTKTITLSSGVIVRADDIEKFYVSVDAANNLDSGDIDSDSWTVDLENIRFEDGSGVVTTETGYEIDGMDVPIAFVPFSTSADTELKISKDSSTPAAGNVTVDDSDTTNDVLLLVGKIKLDGTSDVVIDSLPVTFTVAGTATGLASTTGSVTLKIGDKKYTETVGSSYNTLVSTVTFDNLDFDLKAGATATFSVYADVESVDGNLSEGDSITTSVTASNRAMADVENEEGDQLDTSSERSGTAIGETQQFRTEGIIVSLVGTPTAVSNMNDAADTGTFTIKYSIKAVGDTVYIASLASSAVTKSVYDSAGVATTSNTIVASIKNETDTTKTSVGNYEIEDGQTETFTLTVTVPNGAGDASDQYYTAVTGILWDLSDDVSPSTTYSLDLDSFQTPPVYLDRS